MGEESGEAGGLMRRLMRGLGRLMPEGPGGERAAAVRMIHRMEVAKDWLGGGPLRRSARRLAGGRAWPVVPGTYAVGDPDGPVAVCVLTSNELVEPCARVPGVAIAGRVYTVNLGIERIVRNVTANPGIRFLLLCGKESKVFHPAQGLRALFANGVTPGERRIVGAEGHRPVLDHVPEAQIEAFRRQVELVDHTGVTDLATLAREVEALASRRPAAPGPATRWDGTDEAGGERFTVLSPGGGGPIDYDPQGFIVITVDGEAGQIVARHYLPDNAPAHEVRARTAEGILQALLRHGLVTQLSHAGYVGVELGKAEAALRLGVRYEQDQPLRRFEPRPPGPQ